MVAEQLIAATTTHTPEQSRQPEVVTQDTFVSFDFVSVGLTWDYFPIFLPKKGSARHCLTNTKKYQKFNE